jgi:hypothetical protein
MDDHRSHIQTRLKALHDEALNAIGKAILGIKSEFIGRGSFGGSRMWLKIEEAVSEDYSRQLRRAAQFVKAIAGDRAGEHVDLLDQHAETLAQTLVRGRRAEVARVGRAPSGRPEVTAHAERVSEALHLIRSNVIGDFRFGVIEGVPMAAQPGVQNIVTVQDVSNSIVNVAQSGHVAGNYRDIGLRLGEILKSDEIQQLPDDARAEVVDLAGHIRDELTNPAPDEGRLKRGLRRIGKALEDFGVKASAGAVGELLAKHFGA